MTPRRYELSDFERSIIEPLLPNKPRGVARSDDRKVLNGILAAAHRDRPGPVATRYEKHDANSLALVKLVAIRIWLRFMSW